MGMMYLYQVLPMSISTPQSEGQSNTLNFTLPWCKIQTAILLCLKHRSKERKGVVPLINVLLMMLAAMILILRIFMVTRKKIELKVTWKYENIVINYSFLHESGSLYVVLSSLLPTIFVVMIPRVLYNGNLHNEHTIVTITRVLCISGRAVWTGGLVVPIQNTYA